MCLREAKLFDFSPLDLLSEISELRVSCLQLVLRFEQFQLYVIQLLCGNSVYFNVFRPMLLEQCLEISDSGFQLPLDIVRLFLAFLAVSE